MATKYVDLTPAWREILPALIALLDQPQTHQFALDELAKMARLADERMAQVTAEV